MRLTIFFLYTTQLYSTHQPIQYLQLMYSDWLLLLNFEKMVMILSFQKIRHVHNSRDFHLNLQNYIKIKCNVSNETSIGNSGIYNNYIFCWFFFYPQIVCSILLRGEYYQCQRIFKNSKTNYQPL